MRGCVHARLCTREAVYMRCCGGGSLPCARQCRAMALFAPLPAISSCRATAWDFFVTLSVPLNVTLTVPLNVTLTPRQLLHRHVAMHWAAIVLQTWYRETLRGGERNSRNLSIVPEGDEGDEQSAPKAQLGPAGSFHCEARVRGNSTRSTVACRADVMSVQLGAPRAPSSASTAPLEAQDSGFFERKRSFHGAL